MKIRFTFEHTLLDEKPISFLVPGGLLPYRPQIGDVIDWTFMCSFGGKDILNIGEAVFAVCSIRWCTNQYDKPYMHCGLGDLYDRFALIRERVDVINYGTKQVVGAITPEQHIREGQMIEDQKAEARKASKRWGPRRVAHFARTTITPGGGIPPVKDLIDFADYIPDGYTGTTGSKQKDFIDKQADTTGDQENFGPDNPLFRLHEDDLENSGPGSLGPDYPGPQPCPPW